MKTNTIITVLIIAFIMASCAQTVTVPPTETALPIETSLPIISLSPTQTSVPSSTPTPNPTKIPSPPHVTNGTIYYQWGMENIVSPYLVWGAQLRNTMNGNCQGFICGGKDLREYDANIWHFLGKGEYGKKVFTFDKPLDTFVIVWDDKMGFDAISGTTIDDKTVSYGYLVNGKLTASYLDGSNFPAKTIVEAEDKRLPVSKPCGIIDPNPDGDNNFNLTGDYQGWLGGAIVWNFLDRGFYNNPFATRKGYSLKSLTIISQPANKISSDQICP